jgi:hypothetical protein
MSLTAAAVVLGLLVVMSLKANMVRPVGLIVCVTFGLALGASEAGPAVNAVMADLGTSMWQALQGA